MIDKVYNEIIEKLILGTKQKKVLWEKTQRETEFRVTLGSSMVTTDNWELDSGNKCVDLALINSDGEIAGRIAFEDNEEEGVDYKRLMELYRIAKSSYYKVDETFDEVLSHLDFKE